MVSVQHLVQILTLVLGCDHACQPALPVDLQES
jgi:hypothetical protein